MAQKNLILIAIGVLVLLVIGYFVYSQTGGNLPSLEDGLQTPEESVMEEKEGSLPPATGNVDDIVNLLLQDADSEAAELADEDNDTSLITSDAQAITEFGQSNDESQL